MKHLHKRVAGAALAALALSAQAHNGEDHGNTPPPTTAPSAPLGPRTEARTPDFELVAALEAGRLVLHIDRFSTNEPVTGAQVEVAAGTLQAVAAPTAPGVYSVPDAGFAQPGTYPLTITIEAADTSDLLTATLEVPAAATTQSGDPGPARWWPWGLAGLLLTSGVGLGALWRGARQPDSSTGHTA